MPSTTRGVARLVLRSAAPTVEPVAAVFTKLPRGEGSENGWAPTERIVPTTTRRMKYERSRHRTTKAARKATAGTAKLTANSHNDVM